MNGSCFHHQFLTQQFTFFLLKAHNLLSTKKNIRWLFLCNSYPRKNYVWVASCHGLQVSCFKKLFFFWGATSIWEPEQKNIIVKMMMVRLKRKSKCWVNLVMKLTHSYIYIIIYIYRYILIHILRERQVPLLSSHLLLPPHHFLT